MDYNVLYVMMDYNVSSHHVKISNDKTELEMS